MDMDLMVLGLVVLLAPLLQRASGVFNQARNFVPYFYNFYLVLLFGTREGWLLTLPHLQV
jgi:hypothetical protein